MCEFCTEHGDGKIWFKNAKNYADDLISDLERRNYIKDFFQSTIEEGIVAIGRLETIYQKRGSVPTRVADKMISQAKIDHFGQVVTIEDIEAILGNAATIVRLPCACRWVSTKKENRCCYAVSYSAEHWHDEMDMGYFGLAQSEGLEEMSKQKAIEQMRTLEDDGAVHTIWTMKTPFIGAICNCTPQECLGLRTLSVDIETMFRGEEVAAVDGNRCSGCGMCENACHFNAITSEYQSGDYKACIDTQKCFGCGLCRNSCQEDAIAMMVRY